MEQTIFREQCQTGMEPIESVVGRCDDGLVAYQSVIGQDEKCIRRIVIARWCMTSNREIESLGATFSINLVAAENGDKSIGLESRTLRRGGWWNSECDGFHIVSHSQERLKELRKELMEEAGRRSRLP